ncbi:MAG: EamA family transporter [Candidatus Saccharimonadales bacterium]|nr:EamA family transporter [Candidatus Saccharimonadales bacterium]
MTWQLAMALHIIAGAGFNIFQRQVAKGRSFDFRTATSVIYVAAWLLGSAYAFSSGSLDFSISGRLWLWLFIAGALFSTGMIARFKALEKVDAAEMQLINNLSIVVAIGGMSLWLGESLAGVQYLGAALIIISTFVVTLHQLKLKSVGVFFQIGLLSALLMGLGSSVERYLLLDIPITTYFVVGWGTQALWTVLLSSRQLKHLKIDYQTLKPLLGLGLMLFLAGSTFVAALSMTENGSVISALRAVKIPATVIGATILLKERRRLTRKTIGTFLAIIGVMLTV